MYVKFQNFHLNLLYTPKFSPQVRHQMSEKYLYVRKIPLELNFSYSLKPSGEPPAFDAWL